jgi:hypothetical protein
MFTLCNAIWVFFLKEKKMSDFCKKNDIGFRQRMLFARLSDGLEAALKKHFYG